MLWHSHEVKMPTTDVTCLVYLVILWIDFVRFASETVHKNNLQYWNPIHPCRLHWLHWVCWGWSNCRISSYICTELCQVVNNTLEKKSNPSLSIQQIILIWQIQIGCSHGIPWLHCPYPAFSLLNCWDEVKARVKKNQSQREGHHQCGILEVGRDLWRQVFLWGRRHWKEIRKLLEVDGRVSFKAHHLHSTQKLNSASRLGCDRQSGKGRWFQRGEMAQILKTHIFYVLFYINFYFNIVVSLIVYLPSSTNTCQKKKKKSVLFSRDSTCLSLCPFPAIQAEEHICGYTTYASS